MVFCTKSIIGSFTSIGVGASTHPGGIDAHLGHTLGLLPLPAGEMAEEGGQTPTANVGPPSPGTQERTDSGSCPGQALSPMGRGGASGAAVRQPRRNTRRRHPVTASASGAAGAEIGALDHFVLGELARRAAERHPTLLHQVELMRDG